MRLSARRNVRLAIALVALGLLASGVGYLAGSGDRVHEPNGVLPPLAPARAVQSIQRLGVVVALPRHPHTTPAAVVAPPAEGSQRALITPPPAAPPPPPPPIQLIGP
jgi:hypothetical protein